MRRTALVAGLAMLSLAGPVRAEDDDMCRNGMFAEGNDSFALARITGPGKAHFLDDMNGCPGPSVACRQKAYVLPGDRVVTGRSRGGYVCTYFPNKVGGSAGWMPRERLAPLAITPRPAQWLGNWADGDNWLRIGRSKAGLRVTGMAFWPSARPSLQDRPGGPNMGEIDGPLRVNGARAEEPGCRVTFHLLGDVLIASDPHRVCDGMNVTFSGVYLRKGR